MQTKNPSNFGCVYTGYDSKLFSNWDFYRATDVLIESKRQPPGLPVTSQPPVISSGAVTKRNGRPAPLEGTIALLGQWSPLLYHHTSDSHQVPHFTSLPAERISSGFSTLRAGRGQDSLKNVVWCTTKYSIYSKSL